MKLHHKSTWKQSRNQQETSSGSPATTSNFPHANKLLLRLARRRRIFEMRWSIGRLAHKCVRCGFGNTQNISIQQRGYWVSFNSLRIYFFICFVWTKRDFARLPSAMLISKRKCEKCQLEWEDPTDVFTTFKAMSWFHLIFRACIIIDSLLWNVRSEVKNLNGS